MWRVQRYAVKTHSRNKYDITFKKQTFLNYILDTEYWSPRFCTASRLKKYEYMESCADGDGVWKYLW